eukprot:2479340-Amphidinium_carterae.1
MKHFVRLLIDKLTREDCLEAMQPYAFMQDSPQDGQCLSSVQRELAREHVQTQALLTDICIGCNLSPLLAHKVAHSCKYDACQHRGHNRGENDLRMGAYSKSVIVLPMHADFNDACNLIGIRCRVAHEASTNGDAIRRAGCRDNHNAGIPQSDFRWIIGKGCAV